MAKEPWLYYLRYRIPFPRDIIGLLDRHRVDIGPSAQAHTLLETLVTELKNNSLSAATSGRFAESFLEHLLSTKATLERDGWKLVQAATANPVQAFGDLLLGARDASYHPGINPTFVDLVDDIMRDGRVTAAESNFLTEKCAEYDVSREALTRILRFKLRFHSPLIALVDEICKDGTVTDIERQLLTERATELGGVPTGEIERLLRRGLSLRHYRSSEDPAGLFPSLIGGFFVCRHILHDPELADDFFTAADEYLSAVPPYSLDANTQQRLSDALAGGLNNLICTEIFVGGTGLASIVASVLAIPNVQPASGGPTVRTTKVSDQGVEIIAKGLRFELHSIDNPRLPLFHHEIIGSVVRVFVNSSHPFLHRSDDGAALLVRQLALSITLTRIELYGDDEILDDFFDRLPMNDKLVARKHTTTRDTSDH